MQYRSWTQVAVLASLLVVLGAGLASAQTPVTSVIIADKAGVTTSNYPMTLSMIFKKGDVADHVYAKIGSQTLTTQTDVKVRWSDSTVKHALVSFLVPSMPANDSVQVDLFSGGTNANSSYATKAQLLATDFDARMSITPAGGGQTTITARNLLNGIATPEYWIKGQVCTEFLIRDFSQNVADQLNVQYYVRYYPGWDGFRVDTVVENCRTTCWGNITYDFNLLLGNSNPQSVFSKTGVNHYYCARWHKTLWQGTTPPAVEIRYDVPYMTSTGLIPNYDLSRTMSQDAIASAYSSYLATPHDILQQSVQRTDFPGTGSYDGRPIYPNSQARYIRTMDNRMKEVTLSWGEPSGSCPIHWRESDPNRSFLNHIMSIDDRPTIWASDPNYAYTKAPDKLPAKVAGSSTATMWAMTQVKAHEPSFCYIPYLVTGDFYYLEEIYFWAGFNLADGNYSYRQSSLGIETGNGQTRGIAWSIRNIADAAQIAPDAHTLEKAYFTEKVNNSLAAWNSTYVNGTYLSNRWIADQQTNLCAGASTMFPGSTQITSPWMDDFVLIVWSHMKDCGFDTGALVDWLGDTVVNRLHNPDFNWYRVQNEWLPVKFLDTDGVIKEYPSWAALSAGIADSGPTSFTPKDVDTYEYIARCALSGVTHLTNGQAAWDWLDNVLPSKSGFNSSPGWDLVPRGYVPATDTMPPSPPYNLQVLSPTTSSLTVKWTAPGDNGLTGTAASYDLRYSTSAITTANWANATQVTGEPTPAIAGSVQSKVVSGLNPGTTYYFAMKASDEVPNVSAMSVVVSGTTTAGSDTTAPAAVTNLATSSPTGSAITLTWTAPGDDGSSGMATSYDIRYSTSTINTSNWASATQVTGEPAPAMAGTVQSMTVNGLSNSTTYYFAIKTSDEVPNTSALSNIASGTTSAPATPTVQFAVSSSSGSEGTTPASISVILNQSSSQTVTVNYAVTGGTATQDSDFTLPASGNMVVALKRDATLSSGGSLASQFQSLGSGDVVQTTVKDASLNSSGNSRYMNYGTNTQSTGATNYIVVSFDLSAYTGATVNKAQLRLHYGSGNSTMQWAAIKSHDWAEGNKNGNYPGLGTAAAGVCWMHPNGLYTTASGSVGWGTNSDSAFSTTSDGQDIYALTSFNSLSSNWAVADLTSTVQDWLNGNKPNYGLYVAATNYTPYLSEYGANYEPVLFLDVTPPSHQVQFAPGEVSKTIDVGIIDDTLVEGAETIQLTLSSPVNATLGTRTVHTFTIQDNDNQPPSVDAGGNQTITLPGIAVLNGTVTDDGQPNPPGEVTTTWSQVSGPGTATFAAALSVDTTASFSQSGTYVLRLTADDGAATAYDTVTLTVNPMPTVQFTQSSGSGSEATTPANMNVTLSSASTETVEVDCVLTDGTATYNEDFTLPTTANAVVALKRDPGLVSSQGSLASQFQTLTADDVVLNSVKDTRMVSDSNSRYMNYGLSTQAAAGTNNILIGFDLSAYAGADIHKAQLRLRCVNGNSAMQWAAVKSHDWAEGNKNGNYPGLGTAAAGACWMHPNGTYTTASGTGGWGTNSDSAFSAAGDGADIYTLTNFVDYPGGAAYCIADVTDIVQDWVSGAKPKYGLYVAAGNHGTYLSEYGTDYEPVLFIDMTLPTVHVVFTPGQTSKTIGIPIVNDSITEPNETIQWTLQQPVAASLGTNSVYTYTILDDDNQTPSVQFSQASSSAPESTTSRSLTVTLNIASTQTVTVNYAVTGGSATPGTDYHLTDAPNYVVALKRDPTLATGGTLAGQFTTLDDTDVVVANVKDAQIRSDGNSAYMNYGTTTQASVATNYMLFGLDMSPYMDKAINKAQFRIRCGTGNTGMQWAGIKSHDWAEGNKNGNYPGLGTAAEGVCWMHPNGLYTIASGTGGWGTNSNSAFSAASDGADIYALTNFSSYPQGAAWCVADLTSLVQDWAGGAKPNYGIYVAGTNHTPYLSEYGTDYEPVLFLDYTLQNGQLTFAPGETSKTINLTVVNDSIVEPDETILVTLSNPVKATLGTSVSHTCTIANDD